MYNGNRNSIFNSKINSSKDFDPFRSEEFSSEEMASLNRPVINNELNDVEHSGLIKIKDSIFIKKKNRLYKVSFEKIKFIESEQNYSFIHTDEQKFIIKISLRKILLLLNNYPIIRVNKKQAINMNYVTTINLSLNSIHFENKVFNLGRTYKNKVLSKLRILS